MIFKPGDTVIKNTGGNKMKVVTTANSRVECIWYTDTYNEGTFNEEDIIPYNEYGSILIMEQRDDYIKQILSENISNKRE